MLISWGEGCGISLCVHETSYKMPQINNLYHNVF